MAEPDRTIYSISRLNREARLLLESGLGVIWVEGEVSNFSRPASGHWYLTLKDREAQLRCAMFRTRNMLAPFTPAEGQQVLARGRVSLYEPRGDYQLIIDHIEEAGLGALKRAFEELKKKLHLEGLFDEARKRPLPAAPARIGVITSPTGAAIRDILHVLARRFPAAAVLIYPVPVQGAAAAPAIVQALQLANARAECDVLLLARGGGSLEDLWAFNDERVARAIAASTLPIVSGIGHEVDFTIADFVADVRAPTPTGAAQLVVPDRQVWIDRFRLLSQRFTAAMRRQLVDEHTQLHSLRERLQRAHPGSRLMQHQQRLDEMDQRLRQAAARLLAATAARLEHLHDRLGGAALVGRLMAHQLRLDHGRQRLLAAIQQQIQRQAGKLMTSARALQAISPLATLARGFAILTRVDDGRLIASASVVQPGDEFDARLADGTLRARVVLEHKPT